MTTTTIDRLNVQDSTGDNVVFVPGTGYLLRSVDAWGKQKPEFVADPFTAIGLTKAQAQEQCSFLARAPHRMQGVETRRRGSAPVFKAEFRADLEKPYTIGSHNAAPADIGHLQHGQPPGPFRTESVRVKHEYADRWLAFFEGKWRRVHIQVRRTFIVYRGEKITIQIEGV